MYDHVWRSTLNLTIIRGRLKMEAFYGLAAGLPHQIIRQVIPISSLRSLARPK
jgi:hypothetical protein